jgi:hypothetical protein
VLFVPQKPLDQMTPAERESWRAWLLDQGKNPQPIKVDTPLLGSTFRYSTTLGSVVEDTVDGGHYVVSVMDGKIQRAKKLKPPIAVGRAARRKFRS